MIFLILLAALQAKERETVSPASLAGNNPWFRVYIGDSSDLDGMGPFTVSTGPSHPWGDSLDIFFDGNYGDAWSSFVTVRSYTDSTDYCLTENLPIASAGFTVVDASVSYPPVLTSIFAGAGVMGVWDITGIMNVEQELVAEGTVYQDSRIRITTRVINDGNVDLSLGMRYEWDYQIAGEDGAYFFDDGGAWTGTEANWTPPGFDWYQVSDSMGTGLYEIYGSVQNISFGGIPATPPDRLSYAAWGSVPSPGLYDYAWDDPSAARFVGGDDSSVGYWWGYTTPVQLLVGDTLSVTQYVFTSPAPVGTGETTPLKGNALKVSPNPAAGFATVALAGFKSGALAVYDASGRLLMEKAVSLPYRLEVEGLAAGVYTVILKSGGESRRATLVVR